LLFDSRLELYTPQHILAEFRKYEPLILRKTTRSSEEFITILHSLNKVIKVIEEHEYSQYLELAKRISPDLDDAIYLALALKLKCPVWSNDKKLKQQEHVAVINTLDLQKVFN